MNGKKTYIIDACALIAFLADEEGAGKIENLIRRAHRGEIILILHKINLLEIYYNTLRVKGKSFANDEYNKILQLPVEIIDPISDEVFFEAARLKIAYRISLADSIALSEALIRKATIINSDHHEFDIVEKNEKIIFFWLR